jgi:hypothetical protein
LIGFLPLLLPVGLGAQETRPTIKTSFQLRTRAEHWNWFESASGTDDYAYVGSLLRAAAFRQGDRLGWRVELAAPLLLGLPENPVAPPPQGPAGIGANYWAANDSSEQAAGIFVKQAFLRFSSKSEKSAHALRAGRFEFIEGLETVPEQSTLAWLERERIAHRLLGNFGWSHVQRSFDGAHYTYDRGAAQLTATGMRATGGVFDTNGWTDLNVNVGYAAVNRRPRAGQHSDWRVFALYYDDARTDPVPLKADNRLLAVRQSDDDPISLATVGGHFVRVFTIDSTSVDVLAWGAVQAGNWGELNQRSYAVALEAGWQPRWTGKPWLRVGYTRTSGDDNALDNEHGTFFQVLPTPRLYARFPLYNLMNIEDAFASLQLRPSGTVQVRAEAHHLRLSEPADLWYSGGGAFDKRTFGYAGRPANGQSELGTLLDLSAEVRLTPRVSVNGYFGWLTGGPVIDRIYPDRPNAALGYLEVEWRRQ